MKWLPFVICVLVFGIFRYSSSAQIKGKYRLTLTDKNNNPYSLSAPQQFLSQRAIDRRTKQNIALNSGDIPVTPAYIDSVSSKGATVLNRSRWFNALTISADSAAMVEIKKLTFIKQIDIIGKWKMKTGADKLMVDFVSPSSVESLKTGLMNYGNSLNQISMLKGNFLHDRCFLGEGMLIAVIDAGFSGADTIHAFDSLRANGRIKAAWDFVDNDSTVYAHAQHGTWVFSVIGANLPGIVVGTAPHASFLLLRSEDISGETIIEEYNWISAAEYADSAGADVLNTSLGYNTFDNPLQNHTYQNMDGNTTPITVGADMAASKGMLVVNAAGNEGGSAWKYIIAPADGDSVLSIGAVDGNSVRASFSSVGPASNSRIKPDVCAQGSGTACINTDGSAFVASGTSMASPVIAGIAACLWQAAPNATAMDIFSAIRKSSGKYTTPDSLTGYGIPDFEKALSMSNSTWISACPPFIPFTFDISPVPVTDTLNIKFYSSMSQTLSFDLFDLTGKRVYSDEFTISTDNYTLVLPDVSHLSGGIYILRLQLNDKTEFRKFLKW